MTLTKNLSLLNLINLFSPKIEIAASTAKIEENQAYSTKVEPARTSLESRLSDSKRDWTRYLDC